MTPTPLTSRSTPALVTIVVVVALLTSGCLGAGSPGIDDAGADPSERAGEGAGDVAPQAGSAPSTNTSAFEPTFADGYGEPFRQYTAGGACQTRVPFVVTSNVTHLRVQLSGDPGSPQGGPYGYMTFELIPPEGYVLYPPGTVGIQPITGEETYTRFSSNVTVQVDDPQEGEWTAFVWPNRLVRDQTWDLTVTVEGDVPDVQLPLREPDGFWDC